MSITKKKKDNDTLKITDNPDSTVTYVTRTQIQTQLDHKELDKARIQLEIDELQADIDLLNL